MFSSIRDSLSECFLKNVMGVNSVDTISWVVPLMEGLVESCVRSRLSNTLNSREYSNVCCEELITHSKFQIII
jgi:hypothetical protein